MKDSDIYIETAVLRAIEDHCFSDLLHEVGGFLVGEIQGGRTKIDGSIAAEETGKEQTQLTFTHDTWELAFKKLELDFSGKNIIGWYHSHPDFGVFLSSYDAFIQANFFAEPGQLALVIDPIRGILGWFIAQEGQTVLVSESKTIITPAPKDKISLVQNESPRGRSSRQGVISIIATVVISALVAAFAYSNGTANGETIATTEWKTKVEQLENDLQLLNDQIVSLQTTSSRVLVSYRVKRGDSLWRIAAIFYGSGTDRQKIIKANPELKSTGLKAGAVIQIPIEVKKEEN